MLLVINSRYLLVFLTEIIHPAFMYALIFGSATNIIMRMGSQQSRFLNQLTDIENFLTVNKFPQDLRNRIEDFFYYHWYNSKGIEHSEVRMHQYC